MRFLTVATLALVTAGISVLAQDKPVSGQAAISGTVIDGSTGAPVADAIVSLSAVSGSQLPAGYQARQLTDARGRFVFQNLPDTGTFQLAAAKAGYLDGGYGRDSAPTDPLRPIVISNGSWAGNLRVNIWSPGVISGMVLDETGEPVVGVFVRVLARIPIAGREELAAGPVTITDDHGQYRISGLFPGRYLVQVPSIQMAVPNATRISAAPTDAPEGALDVDDTARLVIGRYPLPPPRVNGRAMAYGISFHPSGSTPAQASVIDLRFGEDRSGTDITLNPVPAVRVSGIVEGPAEALATLTLRLLPIGMENLGLGAEAATAMVSADGSFAFLNVPAGEYWLDAPITFNEFTIASGATQSGGFVGSRGVSLPPPPPRGSWSRQGQTVNGPPGVSFAASDYRGATGTLVPPVSARVPLTVGTADISGIAVRLRQNATLRGKIVVETDPSKPSPPQAARFSVSMDPAGGQASLGMPRALASPGEQFEITGIQPGEYFLRVQSGTLWSVKSIEWRGRDHTTIPFDASANDDFSGVSVTVTNATPILSGSVRDPDGSAADAAMVIVFPAQAAQRVNTGLLSTRFASAPVLTNGTFRLMTLPAGEYVVAAIGRAQSANWRNPAFLAAVERLAPRVTLVWGQSTSQDLTTMVIR